jgi:hypothetical protein
LIASLASPRKFHLDLERDVWDVFALALQRLCEPGRFAAYLTKLTEDMASVFSRKISMC